MFSSTDHQGSVQYTIILHACTPCYRYNILLLQKKFGLPTPHNNDGKMTKETLTWLHEVQSDKAAKIISKRLDDYREKSQPQLGKVHDP